MISALKRKHPGMALTVVVRGSVLGQFFSGIWLFFSIVNSPFFLVLVALDFDDLLCKLTIG